MLGFCHAFKRIGGVRESKSHGGQTVSAVAPGGNRRFEVVSAIGVEWGNSDDGIGHARNARAQDAEPAKCHQVGMAAGGASRSIEVGLEDDRASRPKRGESRGEKGFPKSNSHGPNHHCRLQIFRALDRRS